MKTLIAANWKMHGDLSWRAKPNAFRRAYGVPTHGKNSGVDILICPPSHMICALVDGAKGHDIHIGGQNCHQAETGAFTGEISANMLADCGATYVIVGHSERRAIFGETDSMVAEKADSAITAKLVPIICVGESREQRESGQADEVVGDQLKSSIPASANGDTLVIAYEPVWAIGTGLVPTLDDIAAMHDHIRGILSTRFGDEKAQTIQILYGGSVKPSNAKDILALTDVNGALIGGAGLDMESLCAIAQAVEG
ncbi:MAG: triose-phosphate isomerase [Robiginitomaculum sp.]|nr:MAG: triose-phosphate isomerase [Robiginitomaculum sp.]